MLAFRLCYSVSRVTRLLRSLPRVRLGILENGEGWVASVGATASFALPMTVHVNDAALSFCFFPSNGANIQHFPLISVQREIRHQ